MNHGSLRQQLESAEVPHGTYRVLFEEIGRTLWSIQFFEDAMGMYLAGVFKIPKGTAAREAWKIVDRTRRSTAGTLLTELRAKAPISRNGQKLLTGVVSERNWLVHRLQNENLDDLYNERQFSRLIMRIRKLSEDALDAQREFGRLMVEWVKKHGATQREIDAITLAKLRARQTRRARR
jgi:hypothetical protein